MNEFSKSVGAHTWERFYLIVIRKSTCRPFAIRFGLKNERSPAEVNGFEVLLVGVLEATVRALSWDWFRVVGEV